MSAKTTIQNKVDKKINRVFNGHAQIKGKSKNDALEEAMKDYIDKCVREQRKQKNDFNYFIELQVTAADGNQTFGCKASSKEEALEKFKNGLHDIVDSQVEVLDLADPELGDIYE